MIKNRFPASASTLCALLSAAASPFAGAQSRLVGDINTVPVARPNGAGNLCVLGDQLFFLGSDPVHGGELWRTDGTPAGTRIVRDLTPGAEGFEGWLPIPVGDRLFFGSSLYNGLWKTDGTAEGTEKVAASRFSPSTRRDDFAVLGNRLVYLEYPPSGGGGRKQLSVSDGTAEGTMVLKSIGQWTPPPWPTLTTVGDLVFFIAETPEHGRELWRTDGTAEGTFLVRDIWPGSAGSNLMDLTVRGDLLYFTADNGVNGWELWKSDGTEQGTVMVRDILPGAGASRPSGVIHTGGLLYFTADDGQHGREMWKSDGTAQGTVMIRDVVPGTDDPAVTFMREAGGVVYFRSEAGGGQELWRTDGTAEGTIRLGEFGGLSPEYTGTAVLGGNLYFSGGDGSHGAELWRTDGTPEGTVMVRDITPGVFASRISSLTAAGNAVYFKLEDVGMSKAVVWRSDGTEEGTGPAQPPDTGRRQEYATTLMAFGDRLVALDYPPGRSPELWITGEGGLRSLSEGHWDTLGSDPGQPVAVGESVFFPANDGVNGRELWVTEGGGPPRLVKDILPGPESSNPANLITMGGAVYFVAGDQALGRELWRSDGTPEGTEPVKDLVEGRGGSNAACFTAIGDRLYFLAGVIGGTVNLWRTDGTPDGTIVIKRIWANSPTYDDYAFSGRLGDSLYFGAEDPAIGYELWKTDGTVVGTTLVKDILPGPEGSNPGLFAPLGNQLFFVAGTAATGQELYKTDGTAAGTVLVKDVRHGSASSGIWLSGVAGNTLFFAANNGSNGTELWKSNGTGSGTVMVRDVFPGPDNSLPTNFRAAGPYMFFTAHFSRYDNEIWRSDGTSAGTIKLRDINPGLEGSTPNFLTPVGGMVYFRAKNPANGAELWRTDGTPAGTVLAEDLTGGDPGDSEPRNFLQVGSRLYFTATTVEHGGELRVMDLPLPAVGGLSAESVTATTAVIRGTVNPNGGATTAGIEFGETASYGLTASVSPPDPPNGMEPRDVSGALTGLLPGTLYHYRLTATNLHGPVSAEGTFRTLTRREDWRRTHFGTISAEGPAADSSDPDGDGLPNFLEWACGLDPKAAGPSPLAPSTSPEGALTLHYTVNVHAAESGIVVRVECGDDPVGEWSPEGITETVESEGDGLRHMRAVIPAGSSGRIFARLKAVMR